MQPPFIPIASGADCFLECMQRSGCWSGGSVSDPARCNNMPELCRIECQGKTSNSWAAIAYSSKDTTSGWSYEKPDKATAERIAVQAASRKAALNASSK
jgi:hypothetical protein